MRKLFITVATFGKTQFPSSRGQFTSTNLLKVALVPTLRLQPLDTDHLISFVYLRVFVPTIQKLLEATACPEHNPSHKH